MNDEEREGYSNAFDLLEARLEENIAKYNDQVLLIVTSDWRVGIRRLDAIVRAMTEITASELQEHHGDDAANMLEVMRGRLLDQPPDDAGE